MSLETYRKELDEIDAKLVETLAKRFEIVKEIWKYKKENNIQILQKWRWQKVLDSAIEQGTKLWLSKEIIEDIWNRIHEESLRLEEKE